jgi:DNA gyrase subunit A
MQTIEPKEISSVLPELFLLYATDVIKDRAIPRIEDGLKPVQRRILYAMYENNNTSHHPYIKSAKTVGTVLGSYHAHGDSSVYDAMVTLSQPFAMRYPLIDGHGNWSSIDGSPAAAYRYTEARLSPVAELLLEDINKDTIDMQDNFDNTTKEPVALGGYFPQLICNPSTGIAVGVATSFVPHYAGDVFKAADYMLECAVKDKKVNIDDIINIIKAPDFPTGGIIVNGDEIADIYRTGHGTIRIRAKYRIEDEKTHKNIVFYELPYKINYNKMMESITKLAESTVEIDDVRDESSSRVGIRIVVELKKRKDGNTQEDWIINKLFKETELQSSYSCNFVAIDTNNRPLEHISLQDMLEAYINRCCLTYYKSIEFDRIKYQERLHAIDIMLFTYEHADEIIRIIKSSENPIQDMSDTLKISIEWAEQIFDMKIRSISKLSKDKLLVEKEDLLKKVSYIDTVLNDNILFTNNVRAKIKEVASNKIFAKDKRRTAIDTINIVSDDRSLIKNEQVVITYTNHDMIRSIRSAEYKTTKGISSGVKTKLKENEVITNMLTLFTKDDLLCFTNFGRCHILPVFKIPIVSKSQQGKYLSTILNLENGERVLSIISADPKKTKDKSLVFVTKLGFIKRLDASKLSKTHHVTKCITFNEGDTLAEVLLCGPKDSIVMISSHGKALHINLADEKKPIRSSGRTAKGVIAMTVPDNEEVVSATIADAKKSFVTVSKHGYVKKMNFSDFQIHGRGSQGSVIKSKENDDIIFAMAASDTQLLVMASESGKVSKVPVKKFKVHARTASGNYGMKLVDNDTVVSVDIEDEDNNIEE